MGVPSLRVLNQLTNFVNYLDEKVSKVFADRKLFAQLQTNNENLIEKYTKNVPEDIWDIARKEFEPTTTEYKGIHIHEAPRFFYVTNKNIVVNFKKFNSGWEKKKLVKHDDVFYWEEKEDIICLVAKEDYSTNAKLGEVKAGDIMDITTSTRNYESFFTKNPTKKARGSLFAPETWRNIKYEYNGMVRGYFRPIDLISLRENNYHAYDPNYDYWEKLLNKFYPTRQTN